MQKNRKILHWFAKDGMDLDEIQHKSNNTQNT